MNTIYETPKCKFGCGQDGIYAQRGFYNRGLFTCCKSSNSCPTNKKKNKDAQPYNDPDKKQEIIKKIKETQRLNNGDDYLIVIGAKAKQKRLENNPNTYSDHLEKMQQSCLEKYGVKNPYQQERVQEKSKQTNLKKYGTEYYFISEECKEKRKREITFEFDHNMKTKFNELKFDETFDDKWYYHNLCYKLTEVSKRLFYKKYDTTQFHLDHRFSIAAGYLNKIPPEIISHPVNLEIITITENCSKQEKCSISIEHLLELYLNSSFSFQNAEIS